MIGLNGPPCCPRCGVDRPAATGSVAHPADPKDDGTRVPAATYAWMIPVATRVARKFGYAIAVHGSMSRDLDLVAIPWVDTASDPLPMIEAIADMVDGRIIRDVKKSPHGRMAWNIVFDGAWHFLDISVMPRQSNATTEAREK